MQRNAMHGRQPNGNDPASSYNSIFVVFCTILYHVVFLLAGVVIVLCSGSTCAEYMGYCRIE